jgi:hypothetical protein
MGLAMTACGGEEVPGCQDAIDSFYGVGCTFIDNSVSPPVEVPHSTALYNCGQINSLIEERCRDEFDAWKTCLFAVDNNAQCGSCSQEADALGACD